MAVNAYTQAQFNKYVPRSFQEMLTPVLHVAQQEEELQNKYSESQDKIDAALSMLNPNIDKESYNKLVTFKQAVSTAAEDLATKGYVDSGRKSNLLALKKTYDTDFTNILNQATQRLQAASIQEQKALQDPTYRYKSARQISIDEGLTNPNIWSDTAVSQGISGAFLQQQVAQQAATLKSEISNSNPTLAKLKTADGKDLLGQYMMSISQGANPQDVATAIANLTGNINEAVGIVGKMTQLVNNVMATNKVEDIFKYGTNEYGSLLGYASQGLYNAVGGTDRQIVKDERDIMKYQQQLELEKRQFEYNLNNGNQSSSVFIPLIGNVSSDFSVELDPKRKEVQTNSTKFKEAAIAILDPESYTKPSGRWDSIGPRPGEKLQDKYKRAGLNTKEFTKVDGSIITPQEASTLLLQKAAALDELDKKLLIANRSFVINDPKGLDYALPGLIANGKILDENNKKISIDLSNSKEKSTLSDLTSGVIKITPSLLAENKLEITGMSGKKVYIDISDKKDIIATLNRAHTQAVSLVNDLDALGLTPTDLVNAQLERDASGEIKVKDNSVVLTPTQKVAYKTYVNTINEQNMALNELTMGLLTDKK